MTAFKCLDNYELLHTEQQVWKTKQLNLKLAYLDQLCLRFKSSKDSKEQFERNHGLWPSFADTGYSCQSLLFFNHFMPLDTVVF